LTEKNTWYLRVTKYETMEENTKSSRESLNAESGSEFRFTKK